MDLEEHWKVWRDASGFWQRYIAKFSPDGQTITGLGVVR